ncbi:FMN-linked oxidoreductase [Ramicandelaber brevisporus]|nr:FMN-linked oxidoreductase [Ramicandelaber brevisporus]
MTIAILRELEPGVAPIKPEFLVPKKQSDSPSDQPADVLPPDDDAAEGGGEPQQSKGKTRVRGRNKDRTANAVNRQTRVDDEVQLCNSVIMGHSCTRGESCKLSHDLTAYLASKEPDIGPKCVIFEHNGQCRFGVKCRFAGAHTNPSDGSQIVNQERVDAYDADTDPAKGGVPELTNFISREAQKQLRSKKYPFPRATWINEQLARDKAAKVDNTDPNATAIVTDVDAFLKVHPREKRPVDFRGKTYLAPLTTVGNLPFRRVCKEFGVDITCSEMAMATNLLEGESTEWALMRRHRSENIFGVQICGFRPEHMIRAAEAIETQCQVDFVDVNCGCPIDAVFKYGAGSALLESPGRLGRIVTGLNAVLSCPVTVKIRMAVKDHEPLAHKLLPRLESWGAGLVTLHGRSRQQRYTKEANWDYIAQCSQQIRGSSLHSMCADATVAAEETISNPSSLPFFGNGDILSYPDYAKRLEQANVDGCMIGRGALVKPWVFQEIKEQRLIDISSKERLEILRRFCDYGLEHWGSDTIGVNKVRRYLCEWQSFLYRYIPVGVLEVLPQKMNDRPPLFVGRDDLETLMASANVSDWVKISELLLGPAPPGFTFMPKHKSNSYESQG